MGTVYVAPGDSAQDTAVLLFEAQEKLELPVDVVASTPPGFTVPQEVADEAGVDYEGREDKTAKKAAAKKSTK